jgi:hypothetical protein
VLEEIMLEAEATKGRSLRLLKLKLHYNNTGKLDRLPFNGHHLLGHKDTSEQREKIHKSKD